MRTLCLALLLISVVFTAGQATHVQQERGLLGSVVEDILNYLLDWLADLNFLFNKVKGILDGVTDLADGIIVGVLKGILANELVNRLLEWTLTKDLLTQLDNLIARVLNKIYKIVNPVLALLNDYTVEEILAAVDELTSDLLPESKCILIELVPEIAGALQLTCPPPDSTADPCDIEWQS